MVKGKFMYIKRNLETRIEKYLGSPEIIAIVGPRQAGKTTLLKKICSGLKSTVYLSFEDRQALNLFNENIKDFHLLYLKGAKYLFIDEFQYAREGGKNLKYLYDTYKIKILISGSSSFDLTHQAIKYLVGRIFVFHLYPFDFGEFLLAKNKNLHADVFLPLQESAREALYSSHPKLPSIAKEILNKFLSYYKEYLIYGGYPRVVLAKEKEEKKEVLKNIFNLYFLREIRDILQLETDFELGRLIKLLALQIGAAVSYNELSQATGLNHTKLLRHIYILEKTFIVQRAAPFYTNKRLEITKAPKVYFYDNGFRNSAINNFQRYDNRTDQGMLNENFVSAALINQEFLLKYWRTKSGAEADFVVEKNEKLYPVEVKASLVKPKIKRGYHSFKEKYSPDKIILLSPGYYSKTIEKGFLFLPIYFI